MENEERQDIAVSFERDYQKELLEIVNSELSQQQLKEQLENYHESDIAEILSEITAEQRLKVYRALGDEMVSEVFAYLEDAKEFVEELSSQKVADLIEEMDADDAVDVLDDLEEDKREEIISLLDEETVNDIRLIDQYEENQIGSRMTTNFITIGKNFSVKQATRSVIEQASENDNISTIYAVNDDQTYYGAISLSDLIIARPNTLLDSIITTAYPFLYASETINNCIESLRDYNEDSIPLLSSDNRVIGVITSAELVDVVGEEIEEDYAKFAGLSEQIDLEEKLGKSISKRLPWLVALMCLGLVVSSLIGLFSSIYTALPILVGFQSLILGMSGNIGTQSLAVTIRVLTGTAVTRKEKIKLIFKELRIGIVNGVLIGGVAVVICTLYIFFFAGKSYDIVSFSASLQVALCIGLALVSAMSVASLSGTLVPMMFKKIGVDPAVASGPLLTTINDMLAATVYYGLAFLLLLL